MDKPPLVVIGKMLPSWWPGDKRIEKYMPPIEAALNRHMKHNPGFTDIYNRAYEAIFNAIEDTHATDLLEACKAALEHMPIDVPEEDKGEMAAVQEKLRAAIAKAEPQPEPPHA